jgi:SAM-dependent methyltransferase
MTQPTMYEFYGQQSLLPTYAGLRTEEDLERYQRMRDDVCGAKLYLPKRIFENAELLQFGPDSGEDALVFARSGAKLTLVEPNLKAHPAIHEYFRRFGLESQLEELSQADMLGYRTDRLFDFIDAEGFIYTVQPTSAWLDVFHRLLRPGGLFMVTYYERFGALIELCLKALYALVKRLEPGPAKQIAAALYMPKWEAVAHTRRFESWVMDVLENPFVRARYFLGATELYALAAERGFELYSAWPAYRDSLAVYWHKRPTKLDERSELDRQHLARSALSFVTGYKLYLTAEIDACTEVASLLDILIDGVDALVDRTDPALLAATVDGFEELAQRAKSEALLADGDHNRARAIALLQSLREAFACAGRGDARGVREITTADRAFIESWGMPNHLAVFAKS